MTDTPSPTAVPVDLREAVARAICRAKGIDADAIGYGMGREMPEGQSYPLWRAQLSAADAAIAEARTQIVAETVAKCAALADEHRARIPNHDPDAHRADLVAQGYGNAALNIAAAIREKVKP